MRRYTVTNAAVHDRRLDALLDPHNTASDVWADTAYRSKESEEKLAEKGLRSRIHHRASRGKPLSQRAQEANRTRSKVRARASSTSSAISPPAGVGRSCARSVSSEPRRRSA